MDPDGKAQFLRQARRLSLVLQARDVLQRDPWWLEPAVDSRSSCSSGFVFSCEL